MKIKDLVLGKSLSDNKLQHEKLNLIWGLPVMASDAVSSVAYAVEEILLALMLVAGTLSYKYVGLISIPIILLLSTLIISYSQIIKHYPQGGGAFSVCLDNYNENVAKLAASSLIVDYILTVAVSVSASTAALVSAFPFFIPYTVEIAILFLILLTIGNLRGVSESSKLFGIPTYIFILTMFLLICIGVGKVVTNQLYPIDYTNVQTLAIKPTDAIILSTAVLMSAFASGCSALTGIEAVSNGVANFKKPAQKTAINVLRLLGIVVAIIFLGTVFLSYKLQVTPIANNTVLSQLGMHIFDNSLLYLLLQISTVAILLLASNTAYTDFPNILNILAQHNLTPRQFMTRGYKLSLSNGIIVLFIISALLVIGFKASTHHLIPLYSVGVFVTFTLSQSGMILKNLRLKQTHYKKQIAINTIGATASFITCLVVLYSKFLHGAWVLFIIIPLLILFMSKTKKYYHDFTSKISIQDWEIQINPFHSNNDEICIVLIRTINKGSIKAINYACEISNNIQALHLSRNEETSQALKTRWKNNISSIPLISISTEYRNEIELLEKYLKQFENQNITVIMPKFTSNNILDRIYHNQTAYFIEKKLLKYNNVTTVLVNYLYK